MQPMRVQSSKEYTEVLNLNFLKTHTHTFELLRFYQNQRSFQIFMLESILPRKADA